MKSGFVAVVGKANAGKSTLINVLVGEKVAIVSPKPQTTRDCILGVYNDSNSQIVFVDTPGVYKVKTELSARMLRSAEMSAKEVDLIAYVIDGHKPLQKDDILLMKKFLQNKIQMIIVYTKVDIMQPEKLLQDMQTLVEAAIDCIVYPVSARKGKNITKLKQAIIDALPVGEKIMPDNILSDKSTKFMVAEIMREKILLQYQKEIPHGVAIIIHKFEKNTRGIFEISLDILCEKQNHKAILIGKQSKALKETLTYARKDMEKLLQAKVFLSAYVKVQQNWRDNKNCLKELGYTVSMQDKG